MIATIDYHCKFLFIVADLIKVVDLPLVRVELARLVAGHGDDPALVDPQLEVHLLDRRPPRPSRRNRLPRQPSSAGVAPEVGARVEGRVEAAEDVGRGLEARRRCAEVERAVVS